MEWKPFWKIVEDSYRLDPIDHFESLKERIQDDMKTAMRAGDPLSAAR